MLLEALKLCSRHGPALQQPPICGAEVEVRSRQRGSEIYNVYNKYKINVYIYIYLFIYVFVYLYIL